VGVNDLCLTEVLSKQPKLTLQTMHSVRN